MARQCSPDDPFRLSRTLARETREDVNAIRQLVVRSEGTAAASWALLRKLERLEAEYFGRPPEPGR